MLKGKLAPTVDKQLLDLQLVMLELYLYTQNVICKTKLMYIDVLCNKSIENILTGFRLVGLCTRSSKLTVKIYFQNVTKQSWLGQLRGHATNPTKPGSLFKTTAWIIAASGTPNNIFMI